MEHSAPLHLLVSFDLVFFAWVAQILFVVVVVVLVDIVV